MASICNGGRAREVVVVWVKVWSGGGLGDGAQCGVGDLAPSCDFVCLQLVSWNRNFPALHGIGASIRRSKRLSHTIDITEAELFLRNFVKQLR